MIDTLTIRKTTDLLALAQSQTTLKRVASTQGGEYAGPCPFCGGHDRFRVQPDHPSGGRWMCRKCTEGRWHDGIEFGRRLWPELSFSAVCQRLQGHTAGKLCQSAPSQVPASPEPSASWQASARIVVDECSNLLLGEPGQGTRAWLRSRGILDAAIRFWKLGFNPISRMIAGLWVHSGLIIPCLEAAKLWYLKIRLLPGLEFHCIGCKKPLWQPGICPHCQARNKYRGVKGNCTRALFGVDSLAGHSLAVQTEGELDAILLHQEAGELAGVLTLGSASTGLDVSYWADYLLPLQHLLLAYDLDAAGRTGADRLLALTNRAINLAVPRLQPGDKDLTDFHMHGGNLKSWLSFEINRLSFARKPAVDAVSISFSILPNTAPFTPEMLARHLIDQAEKAAETATALEQAGCLEQSRLELERFGQLWVNAMEILGVEGTIPWPEWQQSLIENSILDHEIPASTPHQVNLHGSTHPNIE